MNLDLRHLSYQILKNHFDLRKYGDLETEAERIFSALLITDCSEFPVVKNFMQKYRTETKDNLQEQLDIPLRRGRKASDHWLYKLLKAKKLVLEEAKAILMNEISVIEKTWGSSEVNNRAISLQGMFKLSELDVQTVLALVVLKRVGENIASLPSFSGQFQDLSRRQERVWSRSQILRMMGEDDLNKGFVLADASSIVISGLIDEGYFDKISISEELYYFFTIGEYGVSNLHKLEERTGPVFELDSFTIDPEQLKILKILAKSNGGKIIILFGESGVGKSELARSLAAYSGKKALYIPEAKPGRENKGLNERKISLSIAALTSNRDNEWVILDEADELLTTKFDPWLMMNKSNVGNKEFLNELFTKNTSNLIIISNSNMADESTLRRASLVIRFDKPDKKQRLTMIETTLKSFEARDLLTMEEMHWIAEMKNMSQGIIGLAVRDSMECSGDPREQKEIFLALIQSRKIFLDGRRNDKRIGLAD